MKKSEFRHPKIKILSQLSVTRTAKSGGKDEPLVLFAKTDRSC